MDQHIGHVKRLLNGYVSVIQFINHSAVCIITMDCGGSHFSQENSNQKHYENRTCRLYTYHYVCFMVKGHLQLAILFVKYSILSPDISGIHVC